MEFSKKSRKKVGKVLGYSRGEGMTSPAASHINRSQITAVISPARLALSVNVPETKVLERKHGSINPRVSHSPCAEVIAEGVCFGSSARSNNPWAFFCAGSSL